MTILSVAALVVAPSAALGAVRPNDNGDGHTGGGSGGPGSAAAQAVGTSLTAG